MKLTSTLDTSSKVITTSSKPSAFPSVLRQKRSAVQTVELSDRKNEAVIKEKCPDCGNDELRYYTVQLRSADEGSTVFYECSDCGHKYAPRSLSIDAYTDFFQAQ